MFNVLHQYGLQSIVLKYILLIKIIEIDCYKYWEIKRMVLLTINLIHAIQKKSFFFSDKYVWGVWDTIA